MTTIGFHDLAMEQATEETATEGHRGGARRERMRAVACPPEELERAAAIVERLCELGVECELVGVSAGPTVTRAEVRPTAGARMHHFRRLSTADDLAFCIGARSVTITAPMPGRGAVAIEWERVGREPVSLNMLPPARFPLTVPVGLDAIGEAVELDLAAAPHVLVAGTTGSGKTTALHGMLCSLVAAMGPDELQLVLIDPKRTEFGPYRSLPHVSTVADDVDGAIVALRGLVAVMESRYLLLQSLGARDLAGANDALEGMGRAPVCRVVVVCDELADLMLSSRKAVEPLLVKLAQKARAVGIHLVLATQTPRVDVVTGLLKNNLPTRIAFALPTKTDSRVVLDRNGAEDLLGQGDGLLSVGGGDPTRIQSPYVSPDEVDTIVARACGREAVAA